MGKIPGGMIPWGPPSLPHPVNLSFRVLTIVYDDLFTCVTVFSLSTNSKIKENRDLFVFLLTVVT